MGELLQGMGLWRPRGGSPPGYGALEGLWREGIGNEWRDDAFDLMCGGAWVGRYPIIACCGGDGLPCPRAYTSSWW